MGNGCRTMMLMPSTLRVRLLALRPRLALTEVQLVRGALLYHLLDGRDHVPNEVRAVRPSPAEWAELLRVLEEARFWWWPRRWPRVDDLYAGEFVMAVSWDSRATVSVGALGAAPEVDLVLEKISQLVGNARRRSSGPVPALLRPGPPSPYQPEALGTAVRMRRRVTHAG